MSDLSTATKFLISGLPWQYIFAETEFGDHELFTYKWHRDVSGYLFDKSHYLSKEDAKKFMEELRKTGYDERTCGVPRPFWDGGLAPKSRVEA